MERLAAEATALELQAAELRRELAEVRRVLPVQDLVRLDRE